MLMRAGYGEKRGDRSIADFLQAEVVSPHQRQSADYAEVAEGRQTGPASEAKHLAFPGSFLEATELWRG
jgi:hypothetical protein